MTRTEAPRNVAMDNVDKRTRVDLQRAKTRGEKLVVVTAYDHASARIVDAGGVDAILVGDSLGMVVQGHDSTLPVTLEHVIYHTQCVTRAKPRAHVVADLPFGTFQRGAEAALDAALRLVQEAGAEAVKLEGAGARLAPLRRPGARLPRPARFRRGLPASIRQTLRERVPRPQRGRDRFRGRGPRGRLPDPRAQLRRPQRARPGGGRPGRRRR